MSRIVPIFAIGLVLAGTTLRAESVWFSQGPELSDQAASIAVPLGAFDAGPALPTARLCEPFPDDAASAPTSDQASEPAACSLLGIGISGLIMLRRLRKLFH